jgi:hypothetical protein
MHKPHFVSLTIVHNPTIFVRTMTFSPRAAGLTAVSDLCVRYIPSIFSSRHQINSTGFVVYVDPSITLLLAPANCLLGSGYHSGF